MNHHPHTFHLLLVEEALKTVERILEVQRNPRLAEKVEHEYDNKYELAEKMTNTAIIAQMNCLERMGLDVNQLKAFKSKPTTLRFKASETCSFLKEQGVEVPMESSEQTSEDTQTTGAFFANSRKSTIKKIVKHVKEYHWNVDITWEISIFTGADTEKRIVLNDRTSSMIVVIQSGSRAPLPEHRDHEPIDVSLTWLLQQIDTEKLNAQFKIDTQTSKTPRRNQQIEDAMTFLSNFEGWSKFVRDHFTVRLQHDIMEKHNPVVIPTEPMPLLKSISAASIFMPIQPFMEDFQPDTKTENSKTDQKSSLSLISQDKKNSSVLSKNDTDKLLNEQIRSLDEKIQHIQRVFPSKHLVKLFTVAEATLVILCEHSQNLGKHYIQCILYMENMLEKQLIAAVGKTVDLADLEQFVKFHNAKFLKPPPKPFCHAIRRPDHYPFGILSIESHNKDGKLESIDTLVREIYTSSPLKMALNAATTLELTGSTFLHGWMNHRCREVPGKPYQLIARARQFSSFMLVIGTMIGSDRLEPKDAIILRDKDEVIIPLLLNDLPSAKEFKDAIQSLSPDQQRFAKAFRSMQLESSVFGVCVIQVKPQLEELLCIPVDSLAKEIQLTQDLMELFVEYQVPSDLLSYDGESNAPVKEKVNSVRENVQAVLDVISTTKTNQLEESAMKADMRIERAVIDPVAPPLPMPVEELSTICDDSVADSEGGDSGSRPTTRRLFRLSASSAMAGSAIARSSPGMPAPPVTMVMKTAKSGTPSSVAYMSVSAPVPPAQAAETSPTATTPTHLFLQKAAPAAGRSGVDFTSMPKMLDASIEKYDIDSALRSTVIKTDEFWTRRRQENLLSKLETRILGSETIKSEKNKAFDLLDALSRSGSLPISYSDLHVLLCVTHCFEKDVMGTVVEDNINPIERLEMSTLLLASTIHGMSPNELIADDKERNRLEATCPELLALENPEP